MTAVVDIPMDHTHSDSPGRRHVMEHWCEANAGNGWRKEWRVGDEIARFHFEDDADAVAFKLTFGDGFEE